MQPNITKSAMLNGLIMGIIFSLNFILSVSNNTTLIMLTNIITIAILVVIYRTTVKFRDTEFGGFITYWIAFKYILYTFFFAALISSVVKFIYFQFINPAYLDTFMYDETMKMLVRMKYPINETIEAQTRSMLKPASYTLLWVWVNVFIGSVVGIILAAFIKKEKSIFTE